MVLIGFSATFHEVLFLYIATGVGSSLANVQMVGLVAHWFLKSIRGRAAGTILTGNALVIIGCLRGLVFPHEVWDRDNSV